jgi:hypothetical protein
MQRVVNTLERGEPSRRYRADVLKVQPLGYLCDLFRRNSDILGVEALETR